MKYPLYYETCSLKKQIYSDRRSRRDPKLEIEFLKPNYYKTM